MDVPTEPASRRSVVHRGFVRTVVVVAVAIAGLAWWGWPTLSGRGDTAPVVVIVTSELGDHGDRFTRALRERGLSARVVVVDGGFCDTVSDGGGGEASRFIVVADPEPGCDPWSGPIDTGRWWWVAPSGTTTTPPGRVTLLDVTWSVGAGGTLRRVCEWWDTCEGDGQVAVRSEPGVLTAAGVERLARIVAATR
jgi:hypothetical protein